MKRFAAAEKRGRLRLIVSPDQAQGSLLIHQDARIYAGLFDGNEQGDFKVGRGRRIYVHVARGSLTANGTVLNAGDAMRITRDTGLHIESGKDAEVLVFDLPGEDNH